MSSTIYQCDAMKTIVAMGVRWAVGGCLCTESPYCAYYLFLHSHWLRPDFIWTVRRKGECPRDQICPAQPEILLYGLIVSSHNMSKASKHPIDSTTAYSLSITWSSWRMKTFLRCFWGPRYAKYVSSAPHFQCVDSVVPFPLLTMFLIRIKYGER